MILVIQSVISIIIIVLILFQERSSGFSGLFGVEGGVYQTRRGIEKILLYVTVFLIIVLVGISIYNLVV
jgi:protein translocase SecG subunit